VLYANAVTYLMAAAFLADVDEVEDWGCGGILRPDRTPAMSANGTGGTGGCRRSVLKSLWFKLFSASDPRWDLRGGPIRSPLGAFLPPAERATPDPQTGGAWLHEIKDDGFRVHRE
jgi:hypothetical protein